MAKVVMILICSLLVTAYAIPVDNDQLDKATVNDVAANAVTDDKKAAEPAPQAAVESGSTVQITGITTGAHPQSPEAANPPTDTPFKPQRTGSMFARFIDDIFQIPITVLQNVAKLITNPFTQRKPEVIATVS